MARNYKRIAQVIALIVAGVVLFCMFVDPAGCSLLRNSRPIVDRFRAAVDIRSLVRRHPSGCRRARSVGVARRRRRSALVLTIAAAVAAAWGAAAVARMALVAQHHGAEDRSCACVRGAGFWPGRRMPTGIWSMGAGKISRCMSSSISRARPRRERLHRSFSTSMVEDLASGTASKAEPTFVGLRTAAGWSSPSTTRFRPPIAICGTPPRVKWAARWPGPRPTPRGLAAIPLACLS